MDSNEKKLVFFETIGSVLWFVMDSAWMFGSVTFAELLILPSVIFNFAIFFYTERSFSPFAVTAAMNAWLMMNILWMVGDMERAPILVFAAKITFGIGMLFLLVAFVKSRSSREVLVSVLRRFRRLRVKI
ncbi:hypothetical protein HY967_01260 [Candidatus Jorgensenbacteria bacterium]|nr:hypothetical protein [Candidatus Jorgensenbacteria bacterium]